MADLTASGWQPSNISVLETERFGIGVRKTLVKMVVCASDFGAGVMPFEGMPPPAPSLVGLKGSISYIIPVCPFRHVTKSDRILVWGSRPRDNTASQSCTLVFEGIGGSASAGPTYPLVVPTTVAASTLFTTDPMVGYGLFVGV